MYSMKGGMYSPAAAAMVGGTSSSNSPVYMHTHSPSPSPVSSLTALSPTTEQLISSQCQKREGMRHQLEESRRQLLSLRQHVERVEEEVKNEDRLLRPPVQPSAVSKLPPAFSLLLIDYWLIVFYCIRWWIWSIFEPRCVVCNWTARECTRSWMTAVHRSLMDHRLPPDPLSHRPPKKRKKPPVGIAPVARSAITRPWSSANSAIPPDPWLRHNISRPLIPYPHQRRQVHDIHYILGGGF